MERLQQLMRGIPGGGGLGGGNKDSPTPDCAEKIHVSSLALLKMLKHGRAGVPMEVMGLMLGQFVDDYTINCVDVFAMPQSGTGVSVEAVDPVFQTKMLDMLKQTGRPEMVVGVSPLVLLKKKLFFYSEQSLLILELFFSFV
jgi:26S proteasome regulatory subunit N11